METKKIYYIMWIIIVAGILVSIKMCTSKNTTSAKMDSVKTSIIEIDGKMLGDNLCDSCELSGSKFICSPALLEKILQNVDSTALKDVSNKSVTFYKNDGYIEVPANMMTNMIDQGLFKKSDK